MWESLTRGVLTGHPSRSRNRRTRRCRGQPCRGPRVPDLAASQDHPAAGRAARHRRPPGARACGAERSPPSPGSASSTTPSWNAAPSPASPPPSWTRSPAPSSSTTPNGPTCSTSPTPPTAPAPACGPADDPAERWTPRPSLQWVLDRFTAPAIVRNGRMDLLAANHLGRAMHASVYETTAAGAVPNFARFTFLHLDAAHDFYPDWDQRRRHLRRHPAHRSRPRPPRQGPARPRRRAVHPQRRLPPPLGQPTTSATTAPAPNASTTASSATSTSPTKAST